MTTDCTLSILLRLGADLGVALADDATLRVPIGHGTEAVVQAADDGALLIHARWQPEADPNVEPALTLAAWLCRNAPSTSRPGAVYAMEAGRSDVTAFSRIEQPATMAPPAIVHWVVAFVTAAAGEGSAPGPMATVDESAIGAQARADQFAALKSDLITLFGLPGEEQDDTSPWMLVPDSGIPVAVQFLPETGDVSLRSVLSVLPTEAPDDERLFRDLLEAHAFGTGTAGAFFGIDAASDEIIVWRFEHVAGLQAADLANAIANVSAVAVHFAPRTDSTLPCLGLVSV